MTRGRGIGGSLATIRVRFSKAGPREGITPKDAFTLLVRPLVEQAMALDGVTGVHAGVTAKVDRAPLSSGSLSLRPNAMDFDGVVMIEAFSQAALRAAMPAVRELIGTQRDAVASHEVSLYNLAYLVTAPAP